MPTNIEKGNIADKLRELFHDYEKVPNWNVIACEELPPFINDFVHAIGLGRVIHPSEIFNCVADLIEPISDTESTCKRETLYEGGGIWYTGCSKCRYPLGPYDRYCSQCGSKVVNQ